MNVALLPLSVELADGEAFRPETPSAGAAVASGRLELYAVLEQDGAALSGRHYLGAVGPGGLFAPQLAETGGVAVVAVATEPTVVARVTAPLAFEAAQAPAVDAWALLLAQALADIAAPAPADLAAHGPDETFDVSAGHSVAARTGLVWFDGAALARPGAEPSGTPAPLIPGLWLEVAADGTVRTGATADLLARPDALAALAAFHAAALAAFRDHLRGRTASAEARAGARAARDENLLKRMTGRFVDVFSHAPGWTGAAAADEPLLAPFTQVAERSRPSSSAISPNTAPADISASTIWRAVEDGRLIRTAPLSTTIRLVPALPIAKIGSPER